MGFPHPSHPRETPILSKYFGDAGARTYDGWVKRGIGRTNPQAMILEVRGMVELSLVEDPVSETRDQKCCEYERAERARDGLIGARVWSQLASADRLAHAKREDVIHLHGEKYQQ